MKISAIELELSFIINFLNWSQFYKMAAFWQLINYVSKVLLKTLTHLICSSADRKEEYDVIGQDLVFIVMLLLLMSMYINEKTQMSKGLFEI